MDRAIAPLSTGDAQTGSWWWGIRVHRAQILFRLGRRAEALEEATAAVESLRPMETFDAGHRLAAAQVVLGRLLVDLGRPRDAEPDLTAAAAYLDRLGAEHPRRAEASCELGRARVMLGAVAERQRLKQCLPIYRAWGLAEEEIVQSLEQALQAS